MLPPHGAVGDWPDDESLVVAQAHLAGQAPDPWRPPRRPLRAAGCFVAFRRGEAGPGHPGDHAWVGAAVVEEGGAVPETVVVVGEAGASYVPGLLARREGTMLLAALDRLATPHDVLLVDATGRDHPRGAGLALHLGAVLDVPSVGITHRPLLARGAEPQDPSAGATSPVRIGDRVVGAWVRTRPGVRPVVAHPGWRTDVATAVEVALRTTAGARTPEPLRVARTVAREARSHHDPPSAGGA